MMNKLDDLTKYPQAHPELAQKSENQKLSDQELDAVNGGMWWLPDTTSISIIAENLICKK